MLNHKLGIHVVSIFCLVLPILCIVADIQVTEAQTVFEKLGEVSVKEARTKGIAYDNIQFPALSLKSLLKGESKGKVILARHSWTNRSSWHVFYSPRKNLIPEEFLADVKLTKKEFSHSLDMTDDNTTNGVIQSKVIHAAPLKEVKKIESWYKKINDSQIQIGPASAIQVERIALCRKMKLESKGLDGYFILGILPFVEKSHLITLRLADFGEGEEIAFCHLKDNLLTPLKIVSNQHAAGMKFQSDALTGVLIFYQNYSVLEGETKDAETPGMELFDQFGEHFITNGIKFRSNPDFQKKIRRECQQRFARAAKKIGTPFRWVIVFTPEAYGLSQFRFTIEINFEGKKSAARSTNTYLFDLTSGQLSRVH
jgi:hypothetical protein